MHKDHEQHPDARHGQMDPVMRQRLGEDTGDNSTKKNVYNYIPGQNWERHGWAGGKRGSPEEEEKRGHPFRHVGIQLGVPWTISLASASLPYVPLGEES